MTYKIGFIGAGNMAEAMAGSIIEKSIFQSSQICTSDPDENRKKYMNDTYKISLCSSNKELIEKSEIIILAVKPQMMEQVLTDSFDGISINKNERKIIISIAAGVTSEKIENIIYSKVGDEIKNNIPVIRVMPNTPSLAGMGMSGISSGSLADEKDLLISQKIMDSMGKSIIVNEDMMNPVTAISGSGPAYFFYFIESLINAGIELGFSEKESFELVFQTAKGAVALMEKTKEAPGELRKKVTSKGGTTEAALNSFMKNSLGDIIIKGANAAKDRAVELSKE
jgi:pyrroline-5-carboxylate reductase